MMNVPASMRSGMMRCRAPCKLVDTAHANRLRTGAFNLRAHLVKQVRQVDYLGLARAILQHRFALGERRRHQQVFGSGDGNFLEDDVSALQPLGASFDVAMFLRDLRSELLQSLEVQIDGARANGAAAGQGHASRLHPREQRPQHQRGGTHGLDQLVRSFGIYQIAAADGGAMLRAPVAEFDLGAHRRQQLALGLNVPHLRNVFQDDGLFGEQSRGHRRQRGVLRTANAHGAQQRIAAANDKLVHQRVS